MIASPSTSAIGSQSGGRSARRPSGSAVGARSGGAAVRLGGRGAGGGLIDSGRLLGLRATSATGYPQGPADRVHGLDAPAPVFLGFPDLPPLSHCPVQLALDGSGVPLGGRRR